MENLPIWAIFVMALIIVTVSIEAGYRLGRLAHLRSEEEKESPTSAFAGAVLALVAFILAFSFGIVSNRYDARRELVRDDANAIRTAYTRADFLPEPDRAEAQRLLREYLFARLEIAQQRTLVPERVHAALTPMNQIQKSLWEMAVAHARQDMDSDVAALYIESLNELTEVHATRIAVGFQERLAMGIWSVLAGLTILGMLGMGYHAGIAGSKRSVSMLFLALAFALVLSMIASLDRPGGFIRVTQQPLMDLQRAIAPAE